MRRWAPGEVQTECQKGNHTGTGQKRQKRGRPYILTVGSFRKGGIDNRHGEKFWEEGEVFQEYSFPGHKTKAGNWLTPKETSLILKKSKRSSRKGKKPYS